MDPTARQRAAAPKSVGAVFFALGMGEAVSRLVSFGTTIYLAKTVGVGAFGSIMLAAAVTLYLSRVVDAGIDIGLGVRDVAAAPDRVDEMVPPVLALRFSLAALAILLTASIALAILPPTDGRVTALYTLTMLPLAGSLRWVVVGLGNANVAGGVRGLGSLGAFVGTLLFVHRTEDVLLFPLVQLAADSAASIALALYARKLGVRVAVRWRLGELRSVAIRVAPFVISMVLGLIAFNADLFFLRIFRDERAVGQYAAAYTILSFIINLGNMHGVSLLPQFTRLQGAPDERDALYRTSSARVVALVLPIVVGGAMLAEPLLRLLFSEEYVAAAPALRLLLISLLFTTQQDIPFAALMSKSRDTLVLRTVASAATSTILLDSLLVPRLGMLGAAIATICTECVRLTVCTMFARRLGFPLPDVTRYWRPVLAALAMAGALTQLTTVSPIIAIPIGAVVYGAVLILTGGVRLSLRALPDLRV